MNIRNLIGWWIADKHYQQCVEVTKNTKFTGVGKWHEWSHKRKYFKILSDTSCEVCWNGNYCTVYKNLEDAKAYLIMCVEKDIPYYERQLRGESCTQWTMMGLSEEMSAKMHDLIQREMKREQIRAAKSIKRADLLIENIRWFGESKYREVYEREWEISNQEWQDKIRLHAYLIAEADGFRKDPVEYWFAGEIQSRDKEYF
jgi:hypothetical protein